jgi:hypothetical protein
MIWVQLRAFSEPMEAEVLRQFLEDHDVPVRVRGNNGRTPVFAIGYDVRLDVPEDRLEDALGVLEALHAAGHHVDPYRGPQPLTLPEAAREVDVDAPRSAPRSRVAFAASLLVPLGGGHLYARHGATAVLLLAGIVGAVLTAMQGRPEMMFAAAALVGFDAVGSVFAARRTAAGLPWSVMKQRLVALLAIGCAYGGALGMGPARPAEAAAARP